MNTDTINNELYRLHQELITFATNNYNDKLEEQYQLYENKLIEDDESRSIYQTGITPWIVSFVVLDGSSTIFEMFQSKIKANTNAAVRRIFNSWPQALPSVYEVISIEKNFVQIREIVTNKNYHIPYQHADDFIVGSLLIGMVIPFAQHHNFFFTMIKLYQRDYDYYRELVKRFVKKDGGLFQHYPDFLATALSEGLMDDQWNQPLHEEVANLFAGHMADKDMNDKIIVNGINLWKAYCDIEDPAIRRIEAYAGALEYLIQREILNNDVTQAKIAEEYGTSPSTLSNTYRRMANVLKEKI